MKTKLIVIKYIWLLNAALLKVFERLIELQIGNRLHYFNLDIVNNYYSKILHLTVVQYIFRL